MSAGLYVEVPARVANCQNVSEFYIEDDTTDLTIPSFKRVSHIDFEDDRPLRVVRLVPVAEEEDLEW